MPDVLARFHPLVGEWFRETLGEPTRVQRESWPHIEAGEHLLATAPTGSGKTLTAFLWAINQFITGALSCGQTRILYVSPLKALNNDIERNLATPLMELRQRFADAGQPFPAIHVATRSGDTDAYDRRRMVRHPPEILITTPESLNLLLSSAGGRTLLGGIHTMILDEIHSLADSKRGAYLMSAVERVVLLSGEFQRLALSATVNPLELVASFVGGYRLTCEDARAIDDADYEPRPVAIVHAEEEKRYEVDVRYPEASAARPPGEKIWDTLSVDFAERIARNRATLLFTNSRVLCEKLTHRINLAADDLVAYSHHGSLAREIRTTVESRLKEGALKAIVATSSLEMGIDVGALDEVLLVQCPLSISSAIQRIGRAGHRVGEVSRGTIYPTHPQDFMEAAVLASAIRERAIEPVTPVACPLDVLAQVIVSMVAMEQWDLDELFAYLRCSYTFHALSRQQYDLVIEMLAGRYAESRIQELRPRISIDRVDNSASARPGALMALYLSGGVIPDRGYYQLRHEENDARLGELDEEFVWEARPGQIFTLGTQQWQIERITHNDVRVRPAPRTASPPPFWKAESRNRDYHFSARIGSFLEEVDACISNDEAALALLGRLALDERATNALLEYLRAQRAHCRTPLPHRHHLLFELSESLPGRASGKQLILHTLWGARVNRPFALALEAAWQERFGTRPETWVDNDCIVLQMPHDIAASELLSLVPAARLEELLRASLEGSGYFAARFRECAGRALLLSKGRFNERKPLWMSRLQSQKLMDAVKRYEDFPILLECWRTCLQDEFDLPALRTLLDEIADGIVAVSECVSATPSPMAHNIAWNQINLYMYQEDQVKGVESTRLHPTLLEEVLRSEALRPAIPPEIIAEFERKRQRFADGYAPASTRDLLDWLVERVAVPAPEWEEMIAAIARDHGEEVAERSKREITARIARRNLGGSDLILPLEHADAVERALTRPPADDEAVGGAATWIGNWLQSYGPVTAQEIRRRTGVADEVLSHALAELLDEDAIISGRLIAGRDEVAICDRSNLEILLRLVRQRARPQVTARPVGELPRLLRLYHARGAADADDEEIYRAVEALRCYPAPAALWESEYLPARVEGYAPPQLDQLFQQTSIAWIGHDERRVSFCFSDDLDLSSPPPPPTDEGSAIANLIPDPIGRYSLEGLMQRAGANPSEIVALLWENAFLGTVTNDSFAALRQGIDCDFEAPADSALATGRNGARQQRGRRGAFNRWRNAMPYSGNWYRLEYPPPAADAIEEEERNKERVRVLLDRYGILFRELLQREAPPFRWPSLFRSLRLMELSGEVLSGHFFSGVPGPQFVSQRMYRLLESDPAREELFWLNATDPHSLCGIGLEAFKGELPRRIPSNHLVYRGNELVFVSRRNGSDLEWRMPPDDPDLAQTVAPLRHLLTRARNPVRQIRVERINGQPAVRSPYTDLLRDAFDTVVDYKHVTLHREI